MNKESVAVEKVYDMTWKEKLLIKLCKLGISGGSGIFCRVEPFKLEKERAEVRCENWNDSR